MRLPLFETDATDETRESHESRESRESGEMRQSPPKVVVPPTVARQASLMIIDDEESIRRALRRYFERLGWVVDDAVDGAEGLVKLNRAEATAMYDVVLCDLKMPGISGQALYNHVLRAQPALVNKFIFATGDAGAPDVVDFLASVSVPVLEKPFELRTLELLAQKVREDNEAAVQS
jgi:CheY-like chemotaxis protein